MLHIPLNYLCSRSPKSMPKTVVEEELLLFCNFPYSTEKLLFSQNVRPDDRLLAHPFATA